MSLIIKGSQSTFEPPPEGQHNAICCDVVDLGKVQDQWGEKHKCRIVWELEAKMKDGKRYIASKKYNVSLHEKANLHKDLKSWRGKPFTSEQLEQFDLESVIGVPCQLVITHNEVEGAVFGNVIAVLKPVKKMTLSGDYTRVINRIESDKKPESGDNPDYSDVDQDPEPDDSVPF